MDNKIFELELQIAHISNSLEATAQIQEKMLIKLDKVVQEHTLAKGWLVGIAALFSLASILFDFKHLVHF